MMESYDNLLAFIRDCLRGAPDIAEWGRVADTQTTVLLDFLSKHHKDYHLLDYGCGNLRVLNALCRSGQTKWHYVGYDPIPPVGAIGQAQTETHECDKDRWTVISRKDFPRYYRSFDFVLVQNVLHEIGIPATALLLQDCRNLLTLDGILLVLDTPLLPKGEPMFIPYYDSDMSILFRDCQLMSIHTQKGLPILFCSVGRQGIPYFSAASRIVKGLLELKRKVFAMLANGWVKNDDEVRQLLHLGADRLFDYMYLSAIVGHITTRLETDQFRVRVSDAKELARRVLSIFVEVPSPRITIEDCYFRFAPDFDYGVIFTVLQQMIGHGLFLFGNDTHDGSNELTPSELCDILLDELEWEKMLDEVDLEYALIQARMRFGDIYPSNAFGL